MSFFRLRAAPLAVFVCTLATTLAAPVSAGAAGAPSGRDPAFEQAIAAELGAIAPEAVPIFQEATAAMDAQDAARAETLFAKVLTLAPGFSHAERRECGALVALERRTEALALCRAALARADSPVNQAALADALVSTKDAPPAADAAEAKELVARATDAKRDDASSWRTALHVSAATNDAAGIERAVGRLEMLGASDPMTDFYAAALAGQHGDLDRASALLARAREHGLPAEPAEHLAEAIEDARTPLWLRLAKGLGVATAVWLGVLGLLLVVGYVLSRATLRAITDRPIEAHVHPGERRLRKAYRAVLWCASAYYYASLPLLLVLAVVVPLGAIAGVLAAGFVSVKLFVILIVVAFGSLVAIGKSVFVRAKEEDPGIPLDLAQNPKVRATLDEVAARIGTRPVDRVFVTPFTEVGVFDRGSLGAQLRGGSDRCLVLGIGVLDGMRLRAFKSVLAHEYGHFHNEDTAGGGFALTVRRSLFTMTIQLVARRVAHALNPAWWFVRGFWRAFLGISQGASRLQEVLADRWAAFAYGSSSFEEGLRHVIERSVRFDAHLGATLDEVVKSKSALPNLYAFAPATPSPQADVEKAIATALAKQPTPFDSHPCPQDRLARVRALAVEGSPTEALDDDAVWSLFADRAAIEAAMTAEVRARLRARRGVTLPAA